MSLTNLIFKLINNTPRHKLIKKVSKKIHTKIKDKNLSNYDFNNESRYMDGKYYLNHSYINIKDLMNKVAYRVGNLAKYGKAQKVGRRISKL